ncbi:hypothetical protein E8E11_002525 [Didymella keratinophila]|nr:hypothetical protein E8E11_002525 [Didymella keratinophila]
MSNSTHLLPTDLKMVNWNRQKKPPHTQMPTWSTDSSTATKTAPISLKTDILPFMILGINRGIVPNDSTEAIESDSHSGYEDADEYVDGDAGEDDPYSYTAENDNFGVIGEMFGDGPTEQQVSSFFPPGSSSNRRPASNGFAAFAYT